MIICKMCMLKKTLSLKIKQWFSINSSSVSNEIGIASFHQGHTELVHESPQSQKSRLKEGMKEKKKSEI